MKPIWRPIFVSTLIFILLSSACGTLAGTSPTPVGTILPESQTDVPTSSTTASATAMATGTNITPLIPITGENVVSMQCQFCVEGSTHAVLVFPDFAYFDVVSTSPVSCFTANLVNGQRILICRGEQKTSFNLNICSDSTNCLQFPVALQECPLIQSGSPLVTSTPSTPIFLTAINTLRPRDNEPSQPTNTALPAQPSVTPPPAATTAPPPSTSTIEPLPTDEPDPTSEPEPTDVPAPTNPPPPTDEPTIEPTEPGGQSRPTRQPSNTPRPTNENRPP